MKAKEGGGKMEQGVLFQYDMPYVGLWASCRTSGLLLEYYSGDRVIEGNYSDSENHVGELIKVIDGQYWNSIVSTPLVFFGY